MAPLVSNRGDACASESKQLAALALEAAASLGDAEAVEKWSREAPSGKPLPLFAPDGPVDALRNAADVGAAYRRAVAAYVAGQWSLASRLGLSVGASGAPLGPEGFILAARASEREGNAARAARMWARANRAGCGAGCVVQPPREDLFGRTARLGRFVPWFPEALCSRVVSWSTGVVNGTWHLTPSGPTNDAHVAPAGYDLREIPSRVLLEHISPPPDTTLLCMSHDGRHRLAAVLRKDGRADIFMSRMGDGWRGPLSVPYNAPAENNVHVLNDGRAIIRHDIGFQSVDPERRPSREVRLPKGFEVSRAAAGASGTVFIAFGPADNAKEPPRYGIARYDVETGKGTILMEDDDPMDLGPADEQDRIVVAHGHKLVWMDGMSGKKLAEAAGDAPSFEPVLPGLAGAGRVFTGAFRPGNEPSGPKLVDLAEGRVVDVELSWHPREGLGQDHDHLRRLVDALPVSAPRSGFDVRTSLVPLGGDQTTKVEVWALELSASGRKGLSVIFAADKKGGMVLGADGRFEFIGQVSPAFRASASCGVRGTTIPPSPSDRVWPLEVCAASLEEPGLTESWFRSADDRDHPPSGR